MGYGFSHIFWALDRSNSPDIRALDTLSLPYVLPPSFPLPHSQPMPDTKCHPYTSPSSPSSGRHTSAALTITPPALLLPQHLLHQVHELPIDHWLCSPKHDAASTTANANRLKLDALAASTTQPLSSTVRLACSTVTRLSPVTSSKPPNPKPKLHHQFNFLV